MRKLFIRVVTLLILLSILTIILLHILSQTPSAKVPGFTSLHLLPERGFKHAVLFAREDIIKDYISQDSLSKWFYMYASDLLEKSPYSVQYSMVVKNAIGKYVLYAKYENNQFILVTRPRFRLKLLRNFIGGDEDEYSGITIKKIGRLYFYFIEDFMVMSDNVDLIKSSVDLALGKRRGSIFDEVGSLEEYDFVIIDNYNGKLFKIHPLVLGMNHKKLVIKGNPVSSVIKDAIKRGKLSDSIPYAGTFFAIKIPYLELYDSYVSYYPDDDLGLSAILWDMGGSGFLWYEPNGDYLFSLSSRVEKERLMRDLFVYLKEHSEVNRVVPDTSMDVYRFMRGDTTVYILNYNPEINNGRFIFTNSVLLYDKYRTSGYVKDDGMLNLKNGSFLKIIHGFSYMERGLIDFYFRNDSIVPSTWKLDMQEYKEGLLIKGKRAK